MSPRPKALVLVALVLVACVGLASCADVRPAAEVATEEHKTVTVPAQPHASVLSSWRALVEVVWRKLSPSLGANYAVQQGFDPNVDWTSWSYATCTDAGNGYTATKVENCPQYWGNEDAVAGNGRRRLSRKLRGVRHE